MVGGDEGDRTLDLRNAIAALSQLSYVPNPCGNAGMLPTGYGFVKLTAAGKSCAAGIVRSGSPGAAQRSFATALPVFS